MHLKVSPPLPKWAKKAIERRFFFECGNIYKKMYLCVSTQDTKKPTDQLSLSSLKIGFCSIKARLRKLANLIGNHVCVFYSHSNGIKLAKKTESK